MQTLEGLSASTEIRLHNQLERVFGQCFGAEEGLCVLVQLATTQMLATGSSRSAIRQALARVVSDHQAAVAGRTALVNGQSRAAAATALTAMMLKWSGQQK